jgi:hypothetical protein
MSEIANHIYTTRTEAGVPTPAGWTHKKATSKSTDRMKLFSTIAIAITASGVLSEVAVEGLEVR